MSFKLQLLTNARFSDETITKVKRVDHVLVDDPKKLKQENDQPVTAEDVESAVQDISRSLEVLDRKLDFSVHEDTNRVIVKVIDRTTQEIIKEIPPEKVLDMSARIKEMIGLLIDELA